MPHWLNWSGIGEQTSGTAFTRTKSVLFDGVDEYVSMGNQAVFNPAVTDPFSVTLWIKRVSGNCMFASKVDGGFIGWYFLHNGSSLNFYMGGTSTAQDVSSTTGVVPTDGAWHFYGLTYDGAGIVKFYVDNTEYGASGSTPATGSTSNTANFRFNGYSGGWMANNYNGDSAYWNKKLSAAEMSDVYNSGQEGDLRNHSASANLVGYWWMGDSDTFPTIKDRKNSYDGTMTNMESGDIVTDAP